MLLVMVTRVALARSSGLASFQNKDEFFVKQSDSVYSMIFAKNGFAVLPEKAKNSGWKRKPMKLLNLEVNFVILQKKYYDFTKSDNIRIFKAASPLAQSFLVESQYAVVEWK